MANLLAPILKRFGVSQSCPNVSRSVTRYWIDTFAVEIPPAATVSSTLDRKGEDLPSRAVARSGLQIDSADGGDGLAVERAGEKR